MPRDGCSLSEVLRSAIEDSGQSYSALARLAGIDDRLVARFASGQRDLTLGSAAKLCEALGLELREKVRPRGRPARTR